MADLADAELLESTTAILVHGAWCDAWAWDPVVEILTGIGVPTVVVSLPLTSFDDDVAAVTEAIAAVAGPITLVGHSYGGSVITQAGNDERVVALAYVAAMVPDVGESTAALDRAMGSDNALRRAQEIAPDRSSISVNEDAAVVAFFAELEPDDAFALTTRLRPTATACFTGKVTAAAWRTTPSVYVLCTEDEAIDPPMQFQLAQRCSIQMTWSTGHFPQFTMPLHVAQLAASAAVGIRAVLADGGATPHEERDGEADGGAAGTVED